MMTWGANAILLCHVPPENLIHGLMLKAPSQIFTGYQPRRNQPFPKSQKESRQHRYTIFFLPIREK
jgi:hypothetical protein